MASRSRRISIRHMRERMRAPAAFACRLAHRTQMSTIEIRHSRMMQEKFSASHIAGYSNATSIVIEIIMRKSISSLTYAED
ncbi:MAG TPA: hypothetical protein VK148_25645 [Xanthobacteraceae bacterium]|jgi:hypothetical protein|nr:hypothetical protein [Xanthobacteraceae bacterium]